MPDHRELVHDPAEAGAIDDQGIDRLEGGHGRSARTAIDERDLAEEVAAQPSQFAAALFAARAEPLRITMSDSPGSPSWVTTVPAGRSSPRRCRR